MSKSFLIDSNIIIGYAKEEGTALQIVHELLDSDSKLYVLNIVVDETSLKNDTSTLKFIEDNCSIITALRSLALNNPKKNQRWKWDDLFFGDDRMNEILEAYEKIAPSDFSRVDDSGIHISPHKNDIDIIVNAVYYNLELVTSDKTMAKRYQKLIRNLNSID